MRGNLLLVDATGIAHRGYHKYPNGFRSSDGMPTWGLVGFISIMQHILAAANEDLPTHGAAVFDPEGPTFRHNLFPKYKNRPGRPEELKVQLPLMHHAADAMGLKSVCVPGFEADDVIATLAVKASRRQYRTTIVSSDKDFCQLVRNSRVEIVDAASNERIREPGVRRKFGVPPILVPDVQALWGDAVDGIPGVDGVGGKRAGGLVRRFGSVQKLWEASEAGREYLLPSVRSGLKRAGIRNLLLYRTLATLKTNVPGCPSLSELKAEPPVREHLEKFCQKFEIKDKVDAALGRNLQYARPVDIHADPFGWWRDALEFGVDMMPDETQCGFYVRRLVRGGPLVPVRIWRDKEGTKEVLRCRVGNSAADANAEWPRVFASPISEADFRKMSAGKAVDPKTPIDMHRAPVPKFGRKR